MQENTTLDQVIREIPVYLSKAFAEQLYVVQYPLMPLTVSLEKSNITEVKIKPKQEKIRVVSEVDTEVRYDKRKEHKTSKAGVNDEEDQIKLHPEHYRVMESCSLPSSSKSSRYVIGFVQGGTLQLASLKSIVQMKEVFQHVRDESEDDQSDVMEAKNLEDSSEEIEPPVKVNLKFTQTRDQGLKSKYAKSFSYFRRQRAEEAWIELAHTRNFKEIEKLNLSTSEGETPFYCLSRRNYLELAFPKITDINPEGNKKKTLLPKIPFDNLKHQSLQDQLRNIFYHAKVLRYSDLVDVLTTRLGVKVDDVALLRSVQAVAVLVQGCWAVKSEFLYVTTHASNSNGITGPEMQRGRDIILSQFNENRLLQRRKMCELTNLPIEEVTEILTDLAVVVPRKGWEFMKPFDTDFVATCRDVVQRQSLMWEMKSANREHPVEFKTPPSLGSSPKRKARTVSFSSDTDSGAESCITTTKSKRPSKKN